MLHQYRKLQDGFWMKSKDLLSFCDKTLTKCVVKLAYLRNLVVSCPAYPMTVKFRCRLLGIFVVYDLSRPPTKAFKIAKYKISDLKILNQKNNSQEPIRLQPLAEGALQFSLTVILKWKKSKSFKDTKEDSLPSMVMIILFWFMIIY